jgi:iron complex transport system ATP-binding protein
MHDINLASLYCDKLVIMKGGCIFKEGKTNDILDKINIKDVFYVDVDIIEKAGKRQIILET